MSTLPLRMPSIPSCRCPTASNRPGYVFRCPCCGYRTLDAPDAMKLCPVCWWEDDGQEDEDAHEDPFDGQRAPQPFRCARLVALRAAAPLICAFCRTCVSPKNRRSRGTGSELIEVDEPGRRSVGIQLLKTRHNSARNLDAPIPSSALEPTAPTNLHTNQSDSCRCGCPVT